MAGFETRIRSILAAAHARRFIIWAIPRSDFAAARAAGLVECELTTYNRCLRAVRQEAARAGVPILEVSATAATVAATLRNRALPNTADGRAAALAILATRRD